MIKIKNIVFILFIFCATSVFSQDKNNKASEKNRSTPKLIATYTNEANKTIIKDSLSKPEL
ncbi:MAG: hypothetical protein KUG68_07680, partial [Flavobacteriaceae bacterium]|nr:hypothetical protein [Flavobacteriaceae bacterium]